MIYITFKSEDSVFCIASSDVLEIVRMVKVTPIPSESGKISGLINYRGETVPVLDMCKYIKNHSKVYETENIIIIASYDNQKVAFVADDIQDIIDSEDSTVENHNILESDFFNRSLRKGNLIYPIVNIKKIINDVKNSLNLIS